MDRQTVATYLDDQYSALVVAAFPGNTNPPDVLFTSAIDAALRAQGVAESDIPTYVTDDTSATQDDDTYALADYYALRLIWRQLATRVATTVGPTQHAYQQQSSNVQALLEDARKEIAHRGYGQDAMQLGRVQLDLYEPLQSGSIQYNPWWGS